MSNRLSAGASVPQFHATASDGRAISSDALLGKAYVLMFYPAVESPGCTLQACQLRDAYADVADLGFEVFGISRDTAAEQEAFTKHHRLSYPMLSDADGKLHASFGIGRWTHPFAILSGGRSRSTFVIDKDGKILAAWYGVQSVGHATKLVSFLRKSL